MLPANLRPGARQWPGPARAWPGPGVARAALASRKRAIVAGPGNPPVVVDETADLDNAAASIVKGAAYDNNLLCIGEKEVFAVESIFDPLMEAVSRNGFILTHTWTPGIPTLALLIHTVHRFDGLLKKNCF